MRRVRVTGRALPRLLVLAVCCGLPGAALAASLKADSQASVEASPAVVAGKDIFVNGAGGSVVACTVCHGVQGQGDGGAGYPAIGGMSAGYVQAQLQSFVKGTRPDPTMAGIAKGMSPAQMAQVAAYVATLSGMTPDQQASVASVGGPEAVKRGRILFQYGKKISREEWVPSCRLCHGDMAQGAGSDFPALAGQHADYVSKQLDDWQKGARSNDPQGLMTSIAVKLSAQDIKDVAAYLAAISNADQPVWPYAPGRAE